MFRLIAIIDKSCVIREGLASLLRRHNICHRIASLENISDWGMAFKDSGPDLVIISPDQWQKNDIKKIRSRYQDKINFVGIIYQYCDRDTLNQFNDTIYITDSEEIIISKLRNQYRTNDDTGKHQDLTAREKDVLRLLLKGNSNKEVADRLMISTHTVIAHRKNIIDKTGIRSLSGLAVYALLNNITDIEQINR